jgi:hypothetical protein
LKANKVNLFVSSVLFVFWYHSPNFLDTPRIFRRVCVFQRLRACMRATQNSIRRLSRPPL